MIYFKNQKVKENKEKSFHLLSLWVLLLLGVCLEMGKPKKTKAKIIAKTRLSASCIYGKAQDAWRADVTSEEIGCKGELDFCYYYSYTGGTWALCDVSPV